MEKQYGTYTSPLWLDWAVFYNKNLPRVPGKFMQQKTASNYYESVPTN